jgi:glycosyltransferase involved in cell wall biosynthesis
MPNSALESLSTGTPVIAPAHGSFPEVIEDGYSGLLFRAGDATHLAEVIRRVMQDDALAEHLSRGAREVALTRYNPEAHYERLMEILGTILGKRPLSPPSDAAKTEAAFAPLARRRLESKTAAPTYSSTSSRG